VEVLGQCVSHGEADLERVVSFAQTASGQTTFEDDFSIVRIDFD
jgi:hypothetical protein